MEEEMMVGCYICEKEFITEADPHAIVFVKGEWLVNCGCYFTKKLQDKIDVLINHDIDEYREVVEYLEKQLEESQKEAATYKAILDIRTNKE